MRLTHPRRVWTNLITAPLLAFALLACSGDPVEEIRTLQNQGRHPEALVLLEEQIEGGDKRPELMFRYGVGLSMMQRWSEAMWPLQAAMEDEEWKASAAMQLASNSLATQNFDLAIETTTTVIELEPESVQPLIMRATAYASTRRHYEEALADAERAAELDPENLDAKRLKILALLGLERSDEAEAALEEAGEAATVDFGLGGGGNAGFWCAARANFVKEKGERERAAEILDACLEEDPTHPMLVERATTLHEQLGNRERVFEIVETAYEKAPDRSLRVGLAVAYHMVGQPDRAEALLREGTESDNDIEAAQGWIDLGGYLAENGRLDDGLDAYERGFNLYAAQPPEVIFAYGEALVIAGRYDDALEIAEIAPEESYQPLLRGRIFYEQGDHEKALEEFTKAISTWPDNAPARLYAAICAERLGQIDRAIEEYRYALRSDPDLRDAKMRLVRLHMAEGETDAALPILHHKPLGEARPTTLDDRLLEIEILARAGRPVRIEKLPEDPRGPAQARALAIAALADGVRHFEGPEGAAEVARSSKLNLRQPANAIVLRGLVLDLLALGQVEEARKLADDALASGPQVAAFHEIAGWARMDADADAADASFRKSLELDATRGGALRGRAQLASRRRDHAQAAVLYQQALALDAADGDAAVGLANARLAQGRRADAVETLVRLLQEHAPYDSRAALRLAELLADSDRERALGYARRSARFGGGQAAVTLANSLQEPASG